MRRPEACRVEEEPRHAGSDCRNEKQSVPAAQPLAEQHRSDGNKSGEEPNKADQDMEERESRSRESQNHDRIPFTVPGSCAGNVYQDAVCSLG